MSGTPPAARPFRLTGAKRELAERRLRARGLAGAEAIPRRPAASPAPLSFGQRRFWFLDRWQPGSPVYNLHVALDLQGGLDAAALAASLAEAARRHEVLRTRYPAEGDRPVQVVDATVPTLPVVDLAGVPAAGELATTLAVEEGRRPFDLARGPVLRALLLRLAERSHVLLLTVHHIAADGWSLGLLVREVGALYAARVAGRPSPLAELRIQYADFAAWQEERLQGEAPRPLLSFWVEQLADVPPAIELPTDRPRPAERQGHGATVQLALGAELTAGLQDLARARGATLFMALLAGFGALLQRYTGDGKVVIGSPVAGRSHPDTEELIGFFVNSLPLVLDADRDADFTGLLARARETALAAFAHQELPFDRLVEELRPERDPARTPVFQVMLVLQNTPAPPLALPGLTLSPRTIDSGVSELDLTLSLTEGEDGLSGGLTWDTDLFDRTTAVRLAGHWQRLLAAAVRDPGQRLSALPLLDEAERHQLTREWNDTAEVDPVLGEIPGETLAERFSRQAARTPERAAVVHGDEVLTYGELERRADRLARFLAGRGIGPEARVGLLLPSSIGMAVALIGVWKAGAAWVPLDPAWPEERVCRIAEDASLALILDREALALAGELPPGTELARPHPDHLAYVIYTSGSAGTPKGVLVRHGAVTSYTRTLAGSIYRGLAAPLRVAANAPPTFDVAVGHGVQLLAGHTLDIVPGDLRLDGAALLDWLAERRIEFFDCTPAQLRLLLAAGLGERTDLRLQRLLVGGEACDPESWRALARRPDLGGWNFYGPTECTVDATGCAIASAPRPVIGRPLPNLRAHVLDGEMEPAPIGVPGHLHLGGTHLARGYLGRPDLTAERFVPDPFGEPGGRLYRTGDRARGLAGGTIEFLGRLDRQLKHFGVRIEPGEIEAALIAHPAVRAAVVALRAGRLVAWVVGDPVPASELRSFLAARLPMALMPALFLPIAAVPLTAHGKVDLRALPDPEGGTLPDAAGPGPRTPVEEVLAAIWNELLGSGPVGRHDSFFALGGHSLLATQAVSRIRRSLGVELALRDLFQAPTVAALAPRVEAALRAGTEAAPPLQPVARETALPLSFAQERLWFLDRLEPGSAAYHVPAAVRLTGDLDPARLAAAIGGIVARHEALRTRFAEIEGRPVQVVEPELRVALPRVDLRALPPAAREAEVRRRVAVAVVRPFDLGRGPLLRALLLDLDEREHVAVLAMHHIVSDGWSRTVLLRELAALYRGEPLPALPIQYADFAVWQRHWLTGGLTGERREEQLAWWRETLAGLPPHLDLPTDRPRPAALGSRGTAVPAAFPAGLARSLAALAQREGVSLFMAVLAAFEALLGRYAGREDVAVGVPLANRTRAEVEDLIGFFVNPVVMRLNLHEVSFRELLGRAREATLGAYAHQDLPFELLVEALAPPRGFGQTPLFQVVLAFQNTARADLDLPGLAASPLPAETGAAKFDLTLALEEDLTGALEYRTDLYDAPTMQRLLGHLETLLAAAVADPDRRIADLPLLTAPERAQVLSEWNDTDAEVPREASLWDLFVEQAAATPDAVAVVQGGTVWTYGELRDRAEALAGDLDLAPETRVALLLDRSPHAIAAILGVLAAGGAYVPLDPAWPRERLEVLLADSHADVVLEHGHTDGHGRARTDTDHRDVRARPYFVRARPCPTRAVRASGGDALAYVMYTSGSTGVPKGVAVPHRGVVRLVRSTGYAAFGPDETILQLAPLAFDASTFEIWGALLHGGRLVLAPPGPPSPDDVAALIVEHGVTTLWLTAGLFHVLAEHPAARAAFGRLRQLLAGGDVLSPPHVLTALTALGGPLIDGYGPTEGTTFSCCHRMASPPRPGPIPIGRPIANTRAYVLGRGMEALPAGVPGELYVAGDGLARGYLDHPDLTAERFLPDPFAEQPGSRLYRTGDLARLLPDGNLDFLGRTDHQVKIRGFRIEPGEIEAALLAQPDVAGATVVPVADAAGERRLAAFYTAADPSAPPSARQLRERLEKSLPAHLVPDAFRLLPVLPLTPNGKVDRAALGREAVSSAPSGTGEPRTPIEELLAGIWAEVLGIGQAGIHDDFFELGGHSLLVARAVARLRESLGVEVPLRALFEEPTPAGLAPVVERSLRGGEGVSLPPIVPVPRGADLAPSFAQERLWFLDRLAPGGDAYNVPWALRLRGRLDPAHLAAALGTLAARHESLRITFGETEGRPVLTIAPAGPVALPIADLTSLPALQRAPEMSRLAAEEARRPFDLARGPLLRAALVRLEGDEQVLLLTLHHAVCDGGSMPILLRELLTLLRAAMEGCAPDLPGLPIQYADHAAWQRRWLAGDVLERELAWWRQALAGAPALLDLPLDRPRPRVRRPRGAVCGMELDAGLAQALTMLGRRHGATLFMTLLAALDVLLARHSGQEDLCVGFPVAGRNRVEVEDLVGLFVNTLVARADLSGDPSFAGLLVRVRERVLAAYAHQEVPFERLVEDLAPRRDLSLTPLFQVLFIHQTQPGLAELSGPIELPGLTVEPLSLDGGTAKLDLTFIIAGRKAGLAVTLDYDATLFDRTTMLRLLGQWRTLLAGIADAPEARLSDLPLLTAPERIQVLEEWSGAGIHVESAACVHHLIETQADRAPGAVALVAGDRELTYAELDAAANRLAHRLRRLGAGPETPVGVCLGRTADLVVALLAVLKAGAAYLPLDPRYPPARLALLLEDSRAGLLITERRWLGTLPAPPEEVIHLVCLDEQDVTGESALRPEVPVLPGHLAYVMYTSGSTGRPKGVGVEHRNVAALIAWARQSFPPAHLESVLAVTSVCFDLSVFELFVPLATGGRVVLVEDTLAAASAPRVTLVNAVPSALAELVRSGGVPATAAVFTLCGEPLPRSLVDALHGLEPLREVINLYGPTETTVYSTVARMERGEDRVPPIGRPLAGDRVYLVDRHLRPVPAGVAGEVLIGGAGIARGYLGRPDWTAARFVPDPFGEEGARLYRTGDLARWRADGELEFLSRIDNQVKLRGFRIEPGEVEAALLAHPDVEEAAVVVREGRLIAYVAPGASVPELRIFLAERLPAYLLPSAIVVLEALPRTANGKVDRAALPAPEGRPLTVAPIPPSGPTEEALARIWEELLGVEFVGANENFFELGGHSLLGAQLLARVRSELQVDLPLQALFETPTVAALAQEVERARRETSAPMLAPVIPRVSEERDAEELLSRLDELSDDEVEALLREMSG